MRLAGNEPDHQTMFLHFSNYESKEHGKSVLGGQWIAGISKQNNMKRNCAEHKHFHFLLCLFLVHPIWSMFCQMLLLVSSGPNICVFRFFTLSIFGSLHLVHVLLYRCSCQFHLVPIFVFLDAAFSLRTSCGRLQKPSSRSHPCCISIPSSAT